MPKIISNPYKVDEELLVSQIQSEYTSGLESVQAKRKIRENDVKKFYVPTTKKDKVSINSVYTTLQTLMSVYYADRMVVEWIGRKITAMGTANSLNSVAKFDYDEMGLDKLDYKWNWDRFFFGVWIKVLDGWNSVTNTPTASVLSPLSWIPDPRGGFSAETHRWAGFEVESTLANLKANKHYYNTDLINWAAAWLQDEIRQAYQSGRSITDQGFEQVMNKKYSIYHHYTAHEGFKYLVTLANDRTTIIRMVRLEPITKEERLNPLLVPFPIALKYYSPVEGDPYGISVPDLMRDKQMAESHMFNLALIKETRNTLWEDLFFNPKVIKNVKQLTTPTINPKAIPANVRDGDNIANSLFRLPKEQQTNAAFNVGSQLQFQNSLSTGLDSNALWIQSGDVQTATEAQITQKNANLRFILGTKIGKWGEETFWKLWMRSYQFNLKPRSKKAFYISSWFGVKHYEFRKRDFITNEMLDVKIVSTSEKESMMQKQKADFFAIAPQLLADPATSNVSKAFIKRKMLRLSNISEDEIAVMQHKSIEEMAAEVDVELINAWEKPTAPKTWQDHLTFIFAFHQAKDNDIKYDAIRERETLYIEEGQNVPEAPTDGTLWNIAASNASQQNSARIADDASWVPSNPWI